MKKTAGVLLFIFIAFACKTDDTKFNKLITEKIQYDVCINFTDFDTDWWIQNIEGPKREKFINQIFSAVKDEKIKIFDLNENEVNLEKVLANLFTFDTIQLDKNGKKDKKIDTVFITNSFNLNNINQIRFNEKWSFNEKTLKISKTVNAFCPVLVSDRGNGESKVNLALFWVFPDTTKNKESNQTLITPKIQYDVFIKSDNQKNNWFADNIETSDRENFVNKIIEIASKGKLKIYDFFDKALDKEKFQQLLHKSDTILVENPEEPGIYKPKIIKTDIDSKSITKIRFIEEWKLDNESFQFYKTVKAISLLTEVRDDSGNIRGYTPVFWIYFDNSIAPK